MTEEANFLKAKHSCKSIPPPPLSSLQSAVRCLSLLIKVERTDHPPPPLPAPSIASERAPSTHVVPPSCPNLRRDVRASRFTKPDWTFFARVTRNKFAAAYIRKQFLPATIFHRDFGPLQRSGETENSSLPTRASYYSWSTEVKKCR